jgi:VanZ family protein
MPARALGAWLPVVLWAALILGLGSDPFSMSETSRILGPLLDWLFPNLAPPDRASLILLARKSAHAIEYGVLALLVFRALRLVTARRALACAAFALVFVAGLAGADERRQAHSSARTGSAQDAALDIAGGAAVLAALLAIERRRGRPLWQPAAPAPDAEAA